MFSHLLSNGRAEQEPGESSPDVLFDFYESSAEEACAMDREATNDSETMLRRRKNTTTRAEREKLAAECLLGSALQLPEGPWTK